jgi:hypothetical protein
MVEHKEALEEYLAQRWKEETKPRSRVRFFGGSTEYQPSALTTAGRSPHPSVTALPESLETNDHAYVREVDRWDCCRRAAVQRDQDSDLEWSAP